MSKDAGPQIYEQGKQIFKEMSMNLREWGSSFQTIRNSFKKVDYFDEKEMKVLSTTWNMDDNCIYTPVKESNEPEIYTKTDFEKNCFYIWPIKIFQPIIFWIPSYYWDLW